MNNQILFFMRKHPARRHNHVRHHHYFVLVAALAVMILLAGTEILAAKDLLASQKFAAFKDANFEIQYPKWSKVDTNTSPDKDSILAAVINNGCVFALVTEKVPADSSFKDFVNARIDSQMQTANINFQKKLVADDRFELDAVIKLDAKTSIKQYAYGGLGANHFIYQITFASKEADFNKACKPSIAKTVAGIRWLTPLSEQPNKKKFNEYFKSLKLGTMPQGQKIAPPKLYPKTTNIVAKEDQLCDMAEIKKTIPSGSFASAIYNTDTKQYAQEKSVFPMELKAGGMAGCGGEHGLSPGNYELKVYLDDVLAAVLPFKIK